MAISSEYEYKIGWISVLHCEFIAAQIFLDEKYDIAKPSCYGTYAFGNDFLTLTLALLTYMCR